MLMKGELRKNIRSQDLLKTPNLVNQMQHPHIEAILQWQ